MNIIGICAGFFGLIIFAIIVFYNTYKNELTTIDEKHEFHDSSEIKEQACTVYMLDKFRELISLIGILSIVGVITCVMELLLRK